MSEAPDTSRISFTALYTGQVWQRNQLGDPVLETSAGRLLYLTVAPINFAGNLLRRGFDLETMLLHRHLLLDHLLDEAIEKFDVRQVVEVAAGMSPRGIRFRRRYESLGLRYIEADLAGMAARKRERLQRGGYLHDDHRVVDCNALASSGPQSLAEVFRAHLDLSRPVAIVTEGLLNYFSPNDLQTMWRGFRDALALCPHGIYLSEIAFDHRGDRFAPIIRAMKAGLSALVRGSTYLHFADAAECEAALRDAGFDDAAVFNPKDFVETLRLPEVDGDSLVRVLRARVRRPSA